MLPSDSSIIGRSGKHGVISGPETGSGSQRTGMAGASPLGLPPVSACHHRRCRLLLPVASARDQVPDRAAAPSEVTVFTAPRCPVARSATELFRGSHNRTVPSWPPLASNVRPSESGSAASAQTGPTCPRRGESASCASPESAKAQVRMEPSRAAPASVLAVRDDDGGIVQRAHSRLVCPRSVRPRRHSCLVRRSKRVASFQTRTNRSPPAVAIAGRPRPGTPAIASVGPTGSANKPPTILRVCRSIILTCRRGRTRRARVVRSVQRLE